MQVVISTGFTECNKVGCRPVKSLHSTIRACDTTSFFPCSEFFGSFLGGSLNTFLSFPVSAVVLGEIILAEVCTYLYNYLRRNQGGWGGII